MRRSKRTRRSVQTLQRIAVVAMRGPAFVATNLRTFGVGLIPAVETNMTNLTRFDPFRSIVSFDPFRSMDDLFYMPRTPLFRALPTEPEMKIDLSEDDKAFHLKADIPGVNKEDIHVAIDGNEVSIGAELKKEEGGKRGKQPSAANATMGAGTGASPLAMQSMSRRPRRSIPTAC